MESTVKTIVTAEPATSKMPTVTVEKFLDAQNGNTKGRNVMFRWVTEARQSKSSLISKLLGPSMAQTTPQQRTALQFMGNDVIESLNLKEGDNFNDAWVKAGNDPLRISISEISQEDFENLEDTLQRGYQPKINPSTGEFLTYKGGMIYLKRYIDTVDGVDEYLQHDNSTLVESSSGDFTV